MLDLIRRAVAGGAVFFPANQSSSREPLAVFPPAEALTFSEPGEEVEIDLDVEDLALEPFEPALPDEIALMADWHRDCIAAYADRKEQARADSRQMAARLKAEKRQLREQLAADLARLKQRGEQSDATAAEIGRRMDRLAAASRAALEALGPIAAGPNAALLLDQADRAAPQDIAP